MRALFTVHQAVEGQFTTCEKGACASRVLTKVGFVAMPQFMFFE